MTIRNILPQFCSNVTLLKRDEIIKISKVKKLACFESILALSLPADNQICDKSIVLFKFSSI